MRAHPRPHDESPTRRPAWRWHGFALLCAAIAFTLQWLLSPWLAPTSLLLLIMGVLAAALYGGQGPGWLATLVSALLAYAFPTEAPSPYTAPGILLFVAAGGLAAALGGRVPPAASRPSRGAEPVPAPEEGLEAALLRSTGDAVLATDAEVKYGAQRPVEVRVRREGRFAWLIVRDHGIGIAPEDQTRIFQRFERAVSERHYGGFGLGLWIAVRSVESQPGQGATFIVRLPLVDDARSEVA